MAWNRPNNGEAVSSPLQSGKSSSFLKRKGFRFPVRGVIAGAVVVVGAAVAWWFLSDSGGRGATRPTETKQKLIKEVKPVVTTNRVEKKKKDVVVWNGQEYPLYDKDGGKAYVTGYGVRYLSKVVITNDVAKKLAHWAAKHFKCPTDRRIAELIDIEPGTAIIGGLKYDPTFTKRFRESLSQPIAIDPTDADEVKDIKQAVIDVRKDLAARLENGEDIGKVIHDTQNELQQLGAYKAELKRQVDAVMRKPTMTEQDLDDCLGAANLMLKERGIEPLTVPLIFRNGIKMREKRMKEMKK